MYLKLVLKDLFVTFGIQISWQPPAGLMGGFIERMLKEWVNTEFLLILTKCCHPDNYQIMYVQVGTKCDNNCLLLHH